MAARARQALRDRLHAREPRVRARDREARASLDLARDAVVVAGTAARCRIRSPRSATRSPRSCATAVERARSETEGARRRRCDRAARARVEDRRIHVRRLIARGEQYVAVLNAVLAGFSYPEIGEKLGISRREVELTVRYLEELLAGARLRWLVDCDDVILLLARERTLTGVEDTTLHVHLDDCEECTRARARRARRCVVALGRAAARRRVRRSGSRSRCRSSIRSCSSPASRSRRAAWARSRARAIAGSVATSRSRRCSSPICARGSSAKRRSPRGCSIRRSCRSTRPARGRTAARSTRCGWSRAARSRTRSTSRRARPRGSRCCRTSSR